MASASALSAARPLSKSAFTISTVAVAMCLLLWIKSLKIFDRLRALHFVKASGSAVLGFVFFARRDLQIVLAVAAAMRTALYVVQFESGGILQSSLLGENTGPLRRHVCPVQKKVHFSRQIMHDFGAPVLEDAGRSHQLPLPLGLFDRIHVADHVARLVSLRKLLLYVVRPVALVLDRFFARW